MLALILDLFLLVKYLLIFYVRVDYVYLAKLLRGEDAVDPEIDKAHRQLIMFFSQDISTKVDFQLVFRKLTEGGLMGKGMSQRLTKGDQKSHTYIHVDYIILPRS